MQKCVSCLLGETGASIMGVQEQPLASKRIMSVKSRRGVPVQCCPDPAVASVTRMDNGGLYRTIQAGQLPPSLLMTGFQHISPRIMITTSF
jgi:hypothetical protein